MLTISELSDLLERNRRRDRELIDRTILAAASLQREFDIIIEQMRANNYRALCVSGLTALADRRDDDQKDHDEEIDGSYR